MNHMAEPGALDRVRAGGKRAVADALSRIETDLHAEPAATLLDEAYRAPLGIVLGLTGPPGVGKSTLIDGLIRTQRARGATVAIVAVDPSSRVTGGALLGDRTRFTTDPADTGVFVRSMAARDRLGGLAEITYPAVILLRALYDLVIVETVGVGQSETAIGDVADRVGVCVQPGSGDALQFMKAGIMEIPDLVIVTKADMGETARRTHADMAGALSLVAGAADRPAPVLLRCSAARAEGLAEVLDAALVTDDTAALETRRLAQANHWVRDTLEGRFGKEGLRMLARTAPLPDNGSPFQRVKKGSESYLEALTIAFA